MIGSFLVSLQGKSLFLCFKCVEIGYFRCFDVAFVN